MKVFMEVLAFVCLAAMVLAPGILGLVGLPADLTGALGTAGVVMFGFLLALAVSGSEHFATRDYSRKWAIREAEMAAAKLERRVSALEAKSGKSHRPKK